VTAARSAAELVAEAAELHELLDRKRTEPGRCRWSVRQLDALAGRITEVELQALVLAATPA